jgi:hypothetical protein
MKRRASGLTMATAAPIWDRQWRQASQTVGGEPPLWIQVFPFPIYRGTFEGIDYEWVTDEESQAAIVANFEEHGNDLAIDYEHLSDKDVRAPGAGRMIELVAGGEKGLLAKCEWNDQGAADIRAGLYWYDSPSFFFGRDDLRIYVLRHLALTNNPASWSRPYITDHNERLKDLELERVAASAGATAPRRNLVLVSATTNNGGMKVPTPNTTLNEDVARSLMWMLNLPLTTTAKELRAGLQSLIDLVPDTDDLIFMADTDDAGEIAAGQSQGKVRRIAKLLAPLVAAAQSSAAPADVARAVTAALLPVRQALGVTDANADGNTLATAVLSLKATTVPASELAEARQRAAQTKEQRADLLVATQRTKRTITPYQEAEIRRLVIVDDNYTMAERFVEMLPPLDLAAQSTTPAATTTPTTTTTDGEGDLMDESKAVHEAVLAIVRQAAQKGEKLTYIQADERRLAAVAATA